MMRRALTACLLAGACAATPAWAQDTPGKADCPDSAQQLSMQAIYGSWEARIDGQGGIATLVLERHPDYEGVRGQVQRPGQPPAQVAGDIDPDGLLALDESQDGKSISASWSGELQPGSCGKTFKGTWRRGADNSEHAFTLHKSGSWK